ncbi:MAG: Smr/MutS family protein [Deltaproteobacteria bacterium]|nr:Smr/MutS family protein [Deltaproteobacteria bacterium]
MINHTYQVLEYYRLLDILSQYASCSLGKFDCLSLKPSSDYKFIDNELRLVSEMRLLYKVKGFFSLSDVINIMPILRRSSPKGSRLEPNELLCILNLAEAVQQTRRFIRSNSSLCPRMCDLVSDLPGYESLVRALKNTISSRGIVKDSASLALRKIREKRIRLRMDLQKKLEGIQKAEGLSRDGQDTVVTVRDGRYVISLRTDQKSRINGIIHDYSQTRTTCFLEPLEVIPDNNRMGELAQEEKDEETRILKGLTDMVRDKAADLEYSQGLIGRIDGLNARARFSEALSCVMPEVGEEFGVELKEAKNPILLALALDNRAPDETLDSPVPVDILLDENHNVLIISGPNRGGKTVTLKTLGLMSLMVQSGIHIPAEEGSKLCVFDQVMADIGDDQDIQSGLSTFSAHAAHLSHIVEHSDQRSLVIIDEPGMGTDPDEGVALAMAVLDFLSKIGSFVAVSTHLNRLKTYGLLNQRTMNASVKFDTDKNRPTFKIEYGSPGISHALVIARNIGMPESILERARGYLDEDEVHLNRLIEKLNGLMTKVRLEKKETEEVKTKYYSAIKKITERLITLEADKKAMMETKRNEAETAVREARNELREAINMLKNRKEVSQARVTEKFTKISHRLMDQLETGSNDKLSREPTEVEEGQFVYHTKLRQKGVVQSVDPSDGRATVILGNLKISAKFQDLEVVKEAKEFGLPETGKSISWEFKGTPLRELNIIGCRVDDAIPIIDRTIDRALVDGELTLRIIHGFGTGKLREAVRAHLNGIPFVKKVGSADPRLGGDAITVVELS